MVGPIWDDVRTDQGRDACQVFSTVETGATVRQSQSMEEMLHHHLHPERQAMQAYLAALALAQNDVALRNRLENQIEQGSAISKR